MRVPLVTLIKEHKLSLWGEKPCPLRAAAKLHQCSQFTSQGGTILSSKQLSKITLSWPTQQEQLVCDGYYSLKYPIIIKLVHLAERWESLVLPYLHRGTVKFQGIMPAFYYSTDVLLSSYHHPRHFEVELFYSHFAKSRITTMVEECMFAYAQPPTEPVA